jgi:hypothetical protein
MTMKVKTAELTGAALDWAVLRAWRPDLEWRAMQHRDKLAVFARYPEKLWLFIPKDWMRFSPSEEWSQGGPIIDKFRPQFIQSYSDRVTVQKIDGEGFNFVQHGSTLLIAAMRCFVASVKGEEVDVPDEIVKATAP